MSHSPERLPADRRRAVIIETVVHLASESDPARITTAAIAKRMNLTQGALFRHFPTKEAVWSSVMEWASGKLLARFQKAAFKAPTRMAALEAMFMAHIDFVVAHPGVPRMLFGELQRAEDTGAKKIARQLIQRYGRMLAAVMEDGKAGGEIDKEINTAAASSLFIGAIQGLVMQSLLTGEPKRMKVDGPKAFELYRRAIRRKK
jgi:AcrR family transcriptional regulator